MMTKTEKKYIKNHVYLAFYNFYNEIPFVDREKNMVKRLCLYEACQRFGLCSNHQDNVIEVEFFI